MKIATPMILISLLASVAYGVVETSTRVTLNLLRGTTTVETVSGPDYATAHQFCEARAKALAAVEVKTSGTLTFTCQTEKLIVTATYSGAKLLFKSGFETAVIRPPVDCWGTGCWQEIAGDGWPFMGGKFLLLSDPVQTTAASIVNRMFNRIEATDRGRSLFQQISVNVNGTGPMGTSSEQNEFQFLPKTDPSDTYISYWMKLQPDLMQKMATDFWGNNGTWRAIFAFKTGGQTQWGTPANDGDYRVEAYVKTASGQPYFAILGDNNAGGNAALVNNWYIENRAVPVPVGRWFKVELFWHRSNDASGRIWFAADGQVIADRRGPNLGAHSQPINRVIAPILYTGSAMPVYQWVDDLEIWDGFPPVGINAPYAAH